MNPSQIEPFNLKNGSLRLYIICFRFQSTTVSSLFIHKNKIITDADLSVTPFFTGRILHPTKESLAIRKVFVILLKLSTY